MNNNSKNDKIVNFNKTTMLKHNKNPKNHMCILFIDNVKKHLETSNNTDSNHVTNENINVVQPQFAKILVVKNELDLLEFYKLNNICGKVPSKPDTSKLTALNIETIRRLNDKLKKSNELITKGKSIFLVNENYWLKDGEN